MRLLKTSLGTNGQLEWIEAWDEGIPTYAILSHTWSETASDEVMFRDVLDGTASKRPAYAKVIGAMSLAHLEGYQYIWIDTLCIDKTSSAELTEAINSMFTYYSKAEVCYVYLSDIAAADSLAFARWWTRGWTLQELLAPTQVMFYTLDWRRIGTRDELRDEISSITGIQQQYLVDSSREVIWTASIAKRMSWAARRTTGRSEDMAYSLLGLFSVNMPLLYGEGGQRAFLRLQEEIMKSTVDHTIFAWLDPHGLDEPHGLLADSPLAFAHTGQYEPYSDHGDRRPYAMTNRGLQMSLHLTKKGGDAWLAALDCPSEPDDARGYLAIVLKLWPDAGAQDNLQRYSRIDCSTLDALGTPGDLRKLFVPQMVSPVAGVRRNPGLFFRLHDLPTPYKLRHVRYDLQLPNPDVNFAAERITKPLRGTEMRKGTESFSNIPMSVRPKSVSGIVIIENRNNSTVFAVMLGCSKSSQPAFDVLSFDDFKSMPSESTIIEQFDPSESGSWVPQDTQQCRITFEESHQKGQLIVHFKTASRLIRASRFHEHGFKSG